jgi:uncharacterized protein with HEPN domain
MKNAKLDSLNRLLHIKKAIEAIEEYVKSENAESFCINRMVHDAVLFQFTVIGETIIHVDSKITASINYPWYKVRAFRNFIAHEYFNIKLSAVWEIIDRELPHLKEVIVQVINEIESKN